MKIKINYIILHNIINKLIKQINEKKLSATQIQIDELRQVCNVAFDKGLLDTHSGNISLGIGKDLLITKTGRSLLDLEPDDFTIEPIACSKSPMADNYEASSEIDVHRFILDSFPGSAIFHAHPINAIALSLLAEQGGTESNQISFLSKKYPELKIITPLDFETNYFFPRIFVFPLKFIDDIKAKNPIVDFKAKDIFKENDVFMIHSHGSFAWGKTPMEALRWTMMLDTSAKIIISVMSATR